MAEKEKKKDKIEQKEIIVSFKRLNRQPMTKRAKKAVVLVKKTISKKMHRNTKAIRLAGEINEKIWTGKLSHVPKKMEIIVLDHGKGILNAYLKGSKALQEALNPKETTKEEKKAETGEKKEENKAGTPTAEKKEEFKAETATEKPAEKTKVQEKEKPKESHQKKEEKKEIK